MADWDYLKVVLGCRGSLEIGGQGRWYLHHNNWAIDILWIHINDKVCSV